MRGVKLDFSKWGTQWLYEIMCGTEDIYERSGMKAFGKVKVETFIKELEAEYNRRDDWDPSCV